jgi:hypothetical protein
MKSLDLFLLDQIDKIKETPGYQKMLDAFSSSEENTQFIIKYVLMILTTVIPLSICLIVYLYSSSLRSDLAVKESIIKSSANIIANTQEVQKISRTVFGQNLDSQNQLKSKISNTLSSSGIDSSKVSISNFNLEEGDSLNEMTAGLKFNSFSSENFYGFINNLVLRDKIKIDEIDVKKNKATNLLDGILSISYHSKVSSDNE